MSTLVFEKVTPVTYWLGEWLTDNVSNTNSIETFLLHKESSIHHNFDMLYILDDICSK